MIDKKEIDFTNIPQTHEQLVVAELRKHTAELAAQTELLERLVRGMPMAPVQQNNKRRT